MKNLTLPTVNTWCPGCGNFFILESIKKAISNFEKNKEKRENFVLVSGVGCHAKIADYIGVNSFYGLHGRAVPVAEGIKNGNPNLKVLCCSGDGDSYNEGISHLIHAAKRNSDITVIVHNNRTFALTVKQFTATSPTGFKGSTTPAGSFEKPINPLELMLASGATFIARGFSGELNSLQNLIEKGIRHKGFSFIEVLQPCVAWFDTYKEYKEKVYDFSKDKKNREEKIKLITEWDYNSDSMIPIGIFYEEKRKTFQENILDGFSGKKDIDVKKIINE